MSWVVSEIVSGVLIFVLLLLFLAIITGIKVVPQSYCYIVERLGKYHASWYAGFHWACPLLDSVVKVIDMREQVSDIPANHSITKDNVSILTDSVVFYQIVDPKAYCYGVAEPISALSNLTITTLRSVIGEMDLDQTLSSREDINNRLRATVDLATDPWGISVKRIELQNITPPPSIQEAMEKQMRAEREKREKILKAEGEKQSMILVAQGQNEAMVLEASAKKKAAIEEAKGQAEAIKAIQQATADGLAYLSAVDISDATVKIKAMEAFAKAADGKATKIIIPSSIQGVAGIAEGLSQTLKE